MKRRRIETDSESAEPACLRFFTPLLNGAESPVCVRRRATLYESCWARASVACERILRQVNEHTLTQVSEFVSHDGVERSQEEAVQRQGRIAAAFINTGANISSQGLFFDQLAEKLIDVDGGGNRVVILKAADATATFKGLLRKIIKEGLVKRQAGGDGEQDDEDEGETRIVGGRKFLHYDLEALAVMAKTVRCSHVFVAFQDSEAFEGGLLSDLIHLFRSVARKNNN